MVFLQCVLAADACALNKDSRYWVRRRPAVRVVLDRGVASIVTTFSVHREVLFGDIGQRLSLLVLKARQAANMTQNEQRHTHLDLITATGDVGLASPIVSPPSRERTGEWPVLLRLKNPI